MGLDSPVMDRVNSSPFHVVGLPVYALIFLSQCKHFLRTLKAILI